VKQRPKNPFRVNRFSGFSVHGKPLKRLGKMKVSSHNHPNKLGCWPKVVVVKEKAAEDVWLRNKEKNTEQFYIRRSASTVELPPSEAVKYIKEHWG
jgi:hypothetical protein